jgi:hypothetical protein
MREYSYEEIVEMRKLVVIEIADEQSKKMDGYPFPAESVSHATAEDRLRTYLMAGVSISDFAAETVRRNRRDK